MTEFRTVKLENGEYFLGQRVLRLHGTDYETWQQLDQHLDNIPIQYCARAFDIAGWIVLAAGLLSLLGGALFGFSVSIGFGILFLGVIFGQIHKSAMNRAHKKIRAAKNALLQERFGLTLKDIALHPSEQPPYILAPIY